MKRKYFLAACLMQFAANFLRSLQGVLLTDYIEYYSLRSASQGILGSLEGIGCIAACLFILFSAGRFKRQDLLCVSGILMTASAVGIFFMPAFPVMLLLYFGIGLGFASCSNLVSSLSASLYPGDVSAMGIVHAFFGTGGLIAPLVLKAAHRAMVWNHVALLDAAVVGAVLILYLAVRSVSGPVLDRLEEKSSDGRFSAARLKQYFSQKRNLLLLLAVVGYQAFQNGVGVWMVRYADLRLSAGALSAVILSSFWIGITFARIFLIRLKISVTKLFCFGCLLSGVLFLAAVLSGNVWATLICVAFAGMSSGAVIPQAYHLSAVWNKGDPTLPTVVLSLAMFTSMFATSPLTAACADGHIAGAMAAVIVYALIGGFAMLPLALSRKEGAGT